MEKINQGRFGIGRNKAYKKIRTDIWEETIC